MLISRNSDYKFYQYDPSEGAAIAFIVVFGILTAAHAYRVVQSRLWYFLVFTVGGGLELGGYIGRLANALETPDWTLPAFIAQNLLLLVAPAFFAASIYMTLGRLVRASGGDHVSFISPKWMTKIFVAGDVASLLMQAGGGGMMTNAEKTKLGEKIIVAGLGVQLAFFVVFVVVAGFFHLRAAREGLLTGKFLLHLGLLYAASALILIRSVFRLIEFAQGNTGYLISHEAFLYAFDAVLMAAVVAIYVVFPPVFHNEFKKRELSREKERSDDSSV